MPYIGSSRYKYSPYLTIHFGSTERFIPGDAVIGSSTFSQLPAFRQAMALHLSFEESDTYIDHSPANHLISTWGSGTLTSGACSASLAGEAEYSITGIIDVPFSKKNVYRPTVYTGTLISGYGGLTAEGDWRRLLENDFTIEGYIFDSRDLYNNGGEAGTVHFNIGDQDSQNQKLAFILITNTDVGGSAMRFRVGEISGTLVTVLSLTTNQFVFGRYWGAAYVEAYPLGATFPPKELTPKIRGTNNWRYWCVEKYGNTIKATVTGNANLGIFIESNSIDTTSYNFGALSIPSGLTTASYSVQPNMAGYNQKKQLASLGSGGIIPLLTPISSYYDDIRITPYARYNGNHQVMGGPIGPARPNIDHFNYNDW